MNYPITDVTDAASLQPYRFHDNAAVTKAGMLPFHHHHYLLAAPKPVRNPDDTVPFAIARGTVEPGETPLQTALREAEEELGVPESHIVHLYDCGVLTYKGYGIHFVAAALKSRDGLLPARDSAACRWVTRDKASAMAATGGMKPAYFKLMQAIIKAIPS